ncbi:MAG: thioredoxin-disulfide reductase [Alphaproteobacteria bacterium]|nr:thioredoxin-disulfide reductase [Alphaproteobacteria bacterium]
MHTKTAIIGSGPAGYTAAIYAARSNLNPIMIMGNLVGGQLLYTHKIENFPGFEDNSGIALVDIFQNQIKQLGVQTLNENVVSVNFKEQPFLLQLSDGNNLTAESVIICTGASPKWLGITGEEKFKGKGISICATCDGFFYRNKSVAVIGGGNTALYEALFLSTLTNHVMIINRETQLSGEVGLRQQVLNNPKIEVINETMPLSFEGDTRLEQIYVKNIRTLEVQYISVDGVFVAIGQNPNTQMFAGQLDMDENGYLITDNQTRQTSVLGIFAAGDVQEKVFRQAIIACGSGAIAALSVEKYLMTKKV